MSLPLTDGASTCPDKNQRHPTGQGVHALTDQTAGVIDLERIGTVPSDAPVGFLEGAMAMVRASSCG